MIKSPDPMPSIAAYITALKASKRWSPFIVHHEEVPARTASSGAPARPLSPEITRALSAIGIDSLYSHQARALNVVGEGANVLVATPTASGKSIIYNLPVFSELLENPQATALYLFPLKALAQDQLQAIAKLASHLPGIAGAGSGGVAAIYDGDTSSYNRRILKENPPRILISNPDMLHLSFLPFHGNWASFFQGLKFVVLDEAHTYRGVFGSHMAWVIRRLRRICRHYGADPQCILSSATVGNPEEMAENLLGLPVTVIRESGAPRGGRHFLFINPLETAAFTAGILLEEAVRMGLRAIVYTQSRKMTELIAARAGNRLGPLAGKLSAYRAGFLPEDRRKIEGKLVSGELLGVVATSALELGIDIGSLDLCILVGYPGTMTAAWQRSGRVGRRQRDSLVILVAQEDALDQYFMRNPREFFTRDIESAVLNPDNRDISRKHLLCAAAELPLAADDPVLSATAVAVIDTMAARGELLLDARGEKWHSTRRYPHREVDLRGSGKGFSIRVEGENRLLGHIDSFRCQRECHPGAVYLHGGKTYVISSLDLDEGEVLAQPQKVSFYTTPLGDKETEILETFAVKQLNGFRVTLGYLRVTDSFTGFERRQVRGGKLISREELRLPPHIFETEGIWLEIPDVVRQRIDGAQLHFMGGIHALEHGMISVFPLLVLCDRNDIGGIACPFHPQLGGAAVFIYDGHPGGVGLSRQAFANVEELLARSREAVRSCSCEIGCPSCVHSPKCGSGNRPMDKEAAARILEMVDDTRAGTPTVREAGGGPVPIAGKIPRTSKKIRYGVFDVETRRSAQEVGGWHRAELMGVSVAVLYDSGDDTFTSYHEDEMGAFIRRLQELDLVVGFNILGFDYQVLSAYTDISLHRLPTLDLLAEIRNRLGYRLSLDHLAGQTLGVKKNADGLMALQWFKEGNFAAILEYCAGDVRITRDLYLYGRDKGYLLFRNKAGSTVRCPVDFILR